jgi:hypothetical protein
MALGEFWRALSRGDGWEKSFGYLTLSQDEIDRGRDLDNKLDQVNRVAFERGLVSQADYDKTSARLAQSSMDVLLENPDSSPWAGFKEGWKEGADNIQSGIKKTLAAPFNFTLGAIPWQVWLLVGGYIAWRMGLLDGIFRRK